MLRQQTGAYIAKITTGYTNNHWLVFIWPLLPGKEIVELLWKPPCNIYRICRSKKKPLIQIFVCKSLLYHTLAIVKCAFYLKSMNIFTKACQLQFLYTA